MEGDCKSVIDAIQTKEAGRSQFHMVIDDISQVSEVFNSVSWSFVGREGNKVAHDLAHYGPWVIGRRTWLTDFPASVSALLRKDLSSNVA